MTSWSGDTETQPWAHYFWCIWVNLSVPVEAGNSYFFCRPDVKRTTQRTGSGRDGEKHVEMCLDAGFIFRFIFRRHALPAEVQFELCFLCQTTTTQYNTIMGQFRNLCSKIKIKSKYELVIKSKDELKWDFWFGAAAWNIQRCIRTWVWFSKMWIIRSGCRNPKKIGWTSILIKKFLKLFWN